MDAPRIASTTPRANLGETSAGIRRGASNNVGRPLAVCRQRRRAATLVSVRSSEEAGYEPHIHRELTRDFKPGDVFLDVGAHVGFFTLAAAIRGAIVVAFEASPHTASVLRRHVQLNHLDDRVTVVEAVVSDKEGKATFYVNEDTMSAAVSRRSIDQLSPERFETPTQEIEQPSLTLDGYCRLNGLAANLVKIDVEGAELAVLRGAEHVLRSDAKVLCEIHPLQLDAAGGSELELLDYVASCGREVTPIDERNPAGIYHAWLQRM